MRRALWHRVVRLISSVGFIALLLAVCLRLRNVNDATLALLMVLCIVGIAIRFGGVEALAAAIAAGIGFDYFLLPPHGLGVASAQHWIALAAFSLTAVATSQLAAQAKRRRIVAERQQQDIEKLYQLGNTLLRSDGSEATLAELAGKMVAIFGADGVAVYAIHNDEIVRAGPGASAISDNDLHLAAALDRQFGVSSSSFSVMPVRHRGAVAGSVGIAGVRMSPRLMDAVAAQVGLGLASLDALQKTTEAAVLRRSEELKSAVLDALAHEIRNPLNSLKLAATTLLSSRPLSGFHRREMLTIINEEVDRMNRFIDESMQLARTKAAELSLKKEPQDLALLIPAAVEDMAHRVGRRPVHVRVPDSLPPAECDKNMMLRVLKQLLNNALKYSPEDSPLTVSAEFTGAAIVIDVVDRGPGVAEDERGLIFEKYYRGRAGRADLQGTGLGLPAAKCIVQAHGGEIWVTSPPEGGAAFHVSLPTANRGLVARVSPRAGAV